MAPRVVDARSAIQPLPSGSSPVSWSAKPSASSGASYLLTRLPGINLDPTLRWPDVTGVACVVGAGFTVCLLVGELSFPAYSPSAARAGIGVLAESLLPAAVGAAILARRNQTYRSHKTAP